MVRAFLYAPAIDNFTMSGSITLTFETINQMLIMNNKYMKRTKYAGIFLAIIAFIAFSAVQVSALETNQETGGDGETGAESNVSLSGAITGGDDETGVENNVSLSGVMTGGDDDNAGTKDPFAATGGDDENGGQKNQSIDNPTGGDDDTAAVSDPSLNTGSTKVNNTSTGSSGRGSSGGGSSFTIIPTLLSVATTSSNVSELCPLITTVLRSDSNNDTIQVIKLQNFLKNSENLNVDINGTFDLKTENAVKAFQVKYLDTVMRPWGASRGSGIVYITTSKKINELACAKPIVFSDSELSIINEYRNRVALTGTGGGNDVNSSDNTTRNTNVNSGNLDFSKTVIDDEENQNTASVAGSSIFSRFWNFIKNLFN